MIFSSLPSRLRRRKRHGAKNHRVICIKPPLTREESKPYGGMKRKGKCKLGTTGISFAREYC